ncbi:acyl-CoA hydrolase [Nitzschia inconspicua]|uniref:Acyl-CoA hydrolase n=1 Tax=Nitzschia inconspicua TaxID=303405 RepID=A0A9K3PTA4_9STRA|nr:acyl-CoA hydrolase [Nitzschia inconspicua]
MNPMRILLQPGMKQYTPFVSSNLVNRSHLSAFTSNSWHRRFSTTPSDRTTTNSNEKSSNRQYASRLKGPIVNQLWTQRELAKEAVRNSIIDMERPRPPSESITTISYPFSTDEFLKEQYRNPFGQMRFGKVLEDLDALAGNIAFAHVQDPDMTIVTASVDRIRLSAPPNLDADQHLSGKVTYVGTSSMEIRMQCKNEQHGEDPWMEAYFTFVAVDPDTKRPLKIPPLDPQTWLEKDQFEAGKRRAQNRKEERKRRQNFGNPLDPAVEKEALRMLREAGPLKNIPSLANPHNILVSHTKQQNCEIAQPQTSNLANQIFGGFLMRRAFELSYATAYVFGGARPRFLEVDEVSFSIPVHVGDLTNFQSHVIYTEVQDEIKDFNLFRGQKSVPLVSVEVEAWIVEPEIASAKLSNRFNFTFALPSGTPCRRVMPSNMEEARRMAIRMKIEHGEL